MINIKQVKELFIQILKNIETNIDVNRLQQEMETLDKNIVQNYGDIMNLSKYSKNTILKIFNDNRNLKTLFYRYDVLQKNNMHKEAEFEAQKIKKFVTELKNKYTNKKLSKNTDSTAKINEVINFLRPHVSLVGEEQAVKDLQRGLSLLNKNRRNSPIEAKNILKQDGIYGNKTQACLCDVCKNYSVNVIKKYIKKGIQNNVIFDTKNNPNVDTKKLMAGLCVNLERSV